MMKGKDKHYLFGLMVIVMKADIKEERDLVKENLKIKKEMYIQVTGMKINNMGLGNSFGLMVIAIQGNISKDRDQERESSSIKVVIPIQETGQIMKSMVEELFFILTEVKKKYYLLREIKKFIVFKTELMVHKTLANGQIILRMDMRL